MRVALEWTHSPGATRCISPEELLSRTRARVLADTLLTLDREEADFVVVGRIEPRADGFRTTLVLRDAAGRPLGERTIDAAVGSCRALDRSLVLALVLLVETPRVRAAARGEATEGGSEIAPPSGVENLDPPSGSASGGPPVSSVDAGSRSETPAAEARAVSLGPPRRISPPPRRPWKLDLGLGASAVGGFVPRPTVGPTFSVVLEPPGFIPIALRGAAYPFDVDRGTVRGEGISVRGFIGGIELCPFGLARRGIDMHVCGGANLAVLQAEPLGPRSYPGDLAFIVLPLRAELRARLGALAPYAAMTARFAPTSASFVHRVPGGGLQTTFEVPWATVELDLGIRWQLLP